MPLVRLSAIALLLCPLWSFAQIAPASPEPGTASQPALFAIAPEASYLWQTASSQSSIDKSSTKQEMPARQTFFRPTGDDLFLVQPSEDKGILIAGDSPTLGDSFCLSIRSYVMARDSKYSDSTHLVRSSTCVPARKYKVKVVQQPDSVIRP